jgi:hypothetical protein
MKRAFVSMPIIAAVSAITWIGCGGGTTTPFASIDTDGGTDEGGTTGGGGSAGGSMGSGGGATTADSGVSFDPGAIGGLVGGGSDGGMAAADGGMLGGGVITPEVVDGCNALCIKEAAANCPNQGTLGDCIVGCRLILNNAKCSTAANALFACEKNSPAACDAQGKATLTGCGVEQLNAASCFLQNATDPTLAGPCKTYCANVGAAKCPNEDPAGCATGCPVIGNFIPGCNMYWKAYVNCAQTAMITCGMDGKANAQGCGLPALAFILCTAGGVVNTGDGGQ